MIAEIKTLDLIDYENWAYWPDDVEDFCVAAEALIGPKDHGGSEIFSFEICTPLWFSKHKLKKPSFVRHFLFVGEYDESEIKEAAVALVASISGENWSELATKLSRYMFWEYEDYQP